MHFEMDLKMKAEDKAKNALGLCMRAGRCILGDFAVEKALKKRPTKVKLLVLDSDASDATKERYEGYCERAEVKLLIIGGAGHAVGRAGGRVIAVTDSRFATMIMAAIGENEADEE